MELLTAKELEYLRRDPARPPEFHSRIKDGVETFIVGPYNSFVCYTHPYRLLRLYCQRHRSKWATDPRISRFYRMIRIRNPHPVGLEKRMWEWSEEEVEFEKAFIILSNDKQLPDWAFASVVAEVAQEIHLRATLRMCMEGGGGVGVSASGSGSRENEEVEDGLDGVAIRALFERQGWLSDEWHDLDQVQAVLNAVEQRPEERNTSGFMPSAVKVLAQVDSLCREEEKKSEETVEVGNVPSSIGVVVEADDRANGGVEAEVAIVSWADEVD